MKPIYSKLFRMNLTLNCQIVNRIVQGNFVIDQELISGLKDRDDFTAIAIYLVNNDLITKAWFANY